MALTIENAVGFNTTPQNPIDSNQRARMKKRALDMLWDEFRIDVGEDGRIPKGEGGTPRVLIFGRNSEGIEGLYDPNELGIRANSDDFVRECEKGNVLVYPTGKEKPVQLGVRDLAQEKNATNVSFTVSEELEPEALPRPPVKKMGFWRGLARVVTLGIAYRGRAREIAQANRAHEARQGKLREYKERRAAVAQRELDDLKTVEANRARRFEKAAQVAAAESAEKEVNKKTVGKRNFVSIFRPDPEFIPELEKITGEDGRDKREGIYTKDHFKDLTVYTKDAEKRKAEQERRMAAMDPEERKNFKPTQYVNFDIQSVELGPNSSPLTNEEFASVAMFTCWRPDIALREYQQGTDYDPTLRGALLQLGYPEDKLDLLMTVNCRSMATTDHFMAEGRDNEGGKFKNYLEPARAEAVRAFQAYSEGNKEQLAGLIANGINRAAESFQDVKEERLGPNSFGTILACKPLFSLMEKDPELKSLALKQGMEPERLAVMKGMIKVNELEDDDRKSERDLINAVVKDQELSRQQKHDCAKKIIMSRLAMQQFKHHHLHVVENPKGEAELRKNALKMDMSSVQYQGPIEQLPPPKPGHIHFIGMQTMIAGLHTVYAPLPKIAQDLSRPEDVRKLDQLAEKIVEQEKLADKSTKELYEGLRSYAKKPINLTEAVERITAPQKSQPQQELNKNAQRQQNIPQRQTEQAGVGIGPH